MGISGSGKTHLATRLAKFLNASYFNADVMRQAANDWEFSKNARIRQSNRMKNVCDFEHEMGKLVIADFICPTHQTREIFDADLIIWMNTRSCSAFADTDKVFTPPSNPWMIINHQLNDAEIECIANQIKEKSKWR